MSEPLPHLAKSRRLTLPALACLTYFTACGGAFGIEPLVGAVGPGWSMALIIAIPLLYSVPIALMVAELTALIPEEGGFYIWVRDSLGPFWAVQEAWWSIGYSLMLLAVYPVLFATYLEYITRWLWPTGALADHAVLVHWLIAVALIGSTMVLNLRGARAVGRSAEFATVLVIGAFVLLVGVWARQGPGLAGSIASVRHDFATAHPGAVLLGLSVSLFNYSNWDNISTYASEVDRPERNYPLALGIAVLLTVLTYALPVLAGVSYTTDPALWSADAGWPAIAGQVGGRWLGLVVAGAGLVSTWGLFNAQLLYVSRVPFVMARDGWLPDALGSVDPVTGAPKASIIAICAIAMVLAAMSFGSLVVMMVLMYTAALVLEFLALVVFRVRRPRVHRPFRVPGGALGLAYVCLAPLAVAAAVAYAAARDAESFGMQLSIIGGIAASGAWLYYARRGHAASVARG